MKLLSRVERKKIVSYQSKCKWVTLRQKDAPWNMIVYYRPIEPVLVGSHKHSWCNYMYGALRHKVDCLLICTNGGTLTGRGAPPSWWQWRKTSSLFWIILWLWNSRYNTARELSLSLWQDVISLISLAFSRHQDRTLRSLQYVITGKGSPCLISVLPIPEDSALFHSL